ncbi:MAG TPA: hypothetical protein VFT51_15395 [Bacillales bacterium]|nr:hypothetical protein [Bacillales bacterium]
MSYQELHEAIQQAQSAAKQAQQDPQQAGSPLDEAAQDLQQAYSAAQHEANPTALQQILAAQNAVSQAQRAVQEQIEQNPESAHGSLDQAVRACSQIKGYRQ